MGIKVDCENRLVVNATGRSLLRTMAIVIAAVGAVVLALAIWNQQPIAALVGLLIMAVGVLPPEYGAKGVRIDFDDAGRHVEVSRLGGVTGRTLERTVYSAEDARTAEASYIGGVAHMQAANDGFSDDVLSTPVDVEWHRYDVNLGGRCIFSTQDGEIADAVAARLTDFGHLVAA